ncbi:MAG TPA: site-2 protease family protein [Acidimicrobiales bacterium]|nr:site-2 protease family protein [Acidimicrobiales bacterium]
MDPAPSAAPERRNTPAQWAVLALFAAVLVWFALRAGSLGRDEVIFFAVLIPSIILHEVSHGAVALLFGDRTAQAAGRLTLNPIKHIDPFWTIILPAMMVFTTGRAFGMAKPVPVNPGRMRSPRNHGMLTALAGPATNLVLAAIAVVLFRSLPLDRLYAAGSATGLTVLGDVLVLFGLSNVILAAFNLLPIPPLDGSSVPERLLPARWLEPYLRIRRYSFFLFIGLFLVGGDLLNSVFDPAIDVYLDLLIR